MTDVAECVLSIVVIVRHPAERAGAVLDALVPQVAGRDAVELILVDGRPDDAPGKAGDAPPPAARRIAAPGLNMPLLKARGAQEARGRAIGFLEPKGVPAPDWVETVLAAIDARPKAALGGAVLFDGQRSPANVAAFIFEYGGFSPDQLSAGLTRDLPGNNMVLPREALFARCGDILAAEGLNKPFCQARLAAGGIEIRMEPEIVVTMRTAHRLGPLLRSRAGYGRCFAGTRMALAGPARRWVYRLGSPAVPVLILAKQMRNVRRASTGPRPAGTLPAFAALCLAWAAGEIAGYWRGPGQACRNLF